MVVCRVKVVHQAATFLFPFLEKFCDGKGMICTPEVWAILPRLVALRRLLLNIICGGAFPCIQQQTAPILASIRQTYNPLRYNTRPHWLHRSRDFPSVETPSGARAPEIKGVGLEGYLRGTRRAFVDVGKILEEGDDRREFSGGEREVGVKEGQPCGDGGGERIMTDLMSEEGGW